MIVKIKFETYTSKYQLSTSWKNLTAFAYMSLKEMDFSLLEDNEDVELWLW